MANMILVGGTGRSGTSIVKEILAHHPDAASLPFEFRFIIGSDGIIDFYTSFSSSWSPYLADRRLKRLEQFLCHLAHEPPHHRLLSQFIRWANRDGKTLSPRSYHGWELARQLPNYEQHVQHLMSRLVTFAFPACWVGSESYRIRPRIYHSPPRSREELAEILGDFVRAVITDFLLAANKTFFVEDNTWNVLFAGEILSLLPEAKILHVYRDPRDVVASFAHQRWSPQDTGQGARWYRDMMTRWFEIRRALPQDSYYELKLEDLVASPELELRKLCAFVQIPFHPVMLNVDLSHSHSGRWKSEFSEAEKRQIHEILGDIIHRLGYDQTGL